MGLGLVDRRRATWGNTMKPEKKNEGGAQYARSKAPKPRLKVEREVVVRVGG